MDINSDDNELLEMDILGENEPQLTAQEEQFLDEILKSGELPDVSEKNNETFTPDVIQEPKSPQKVGKSLKITQNSSPSPSTSSIPSKLTSDTLNLVKKHKIAEETSPTPSKIPCISTTKGRQSFLKAVLEKNRKELVEQHKNQAIIELGINHVNEEKKRVASLKTKQRPPVVVPKPPVNPAPEIVLGSDRLKVIERPIRLAQSPSRAPTTFTQNGQKTVCMDPESYFLWRYHAQDKMDKMALVKKKNSNLEKFVGKNKNNLVPICAEYQLISANGSKTDKASLYDENSSTTDSDTELIIEKDPFKNQQNPSTQKRMENSNSKEISIKNQRIPTSQPKIVKRQTIFQGDDDPFGSNLDPLDDPLNVQNAENSVEDESDMAENPSGFIIYYDSSEDDSPTKIGKNRKNHQKNQEDPLANQSDSTASESELDNLICEENPDKSQQDPSTAYEHEFYSYQQKLISTQNYNSNQPKTQQSNLKINSSFSIAAESPKFPVKQLEKKSPKSEALTMKLLREREHAKIQIQDLMAKNNERINLKAALLKSAGVAVKNPKLEIGNVQKITPSSDIQNPNKWVIHFKNGDKKVILEQNKITKDQPSTSKTTSLLQKPGDKTRAEKQLKDLAPKGDSFENRQIKLMNKNILGSQLQKTTKSQELANSLRNNQGQKISDKIIVHNSQISNSKALNRTSINKIDLQPGMVIPIKLVEPPHRPSSTQKRKPKKSVNIPVEVPQNLELESFVKVEEEEVGCVSENYGQHYSEQNVVFEIFEVGEEIKQEVVEVKQEVVETTIEEPEKEDTGETSNYCQLCKTQFESAEKYKIHLPIHSEYWKQLAIAHKKQKSVKLSNPAFTLANSIKIGSKILTKNVPLNSNLKSSNIIEAFNVKKPSNAVKIGYKIIPQSANTSFKLPIISTPLNKDSLKSAKIVKTLELKKPKKEDQFKKNVTEFLTSGTHLRCPKCLVTFPDAKALKIHLPIHEFYFEAEMLEKTLWTGQTFYIQQPYSNYAFLVSCETPNKKYIQCFVAKCKVRGYGTPNGKFFINKTDTHSHTAHQLANDAEFEQLTAIENQKRQILNVNLSNGRK